MGVRGTETVPWKKINKESIHSADRMMPLRAEALIKINQFTFGNHKSFPDITNYYGWFWFMIRAYFLYSLSLSLSSYM